MVKIPYAMFRIRKPSYRYFSSAIMREMFEAKEWGLVMTVMLYANIRAG